MKDDFTSKDYVEPEMIPLPELRRIQAQQERQAAIDKVRAEFQKITDMARAIRYRRGG